MHRTGSALSSPPDPRRRRVWITIWVWSLAWTLAYARRAGGTWHYFRDGARLLFSGAKDGGLHLYAAHPDLQIGPLAFLVAAPLAPLNASAGQVLNVILLAGTGPALLLAIWRLVPEPSRDPTRLLFAALAFLPIWSILATHAGHLDDVLALCFAVAAMHARAHHRPVMLGLLIAAATDAKPWALAFTPLLLVRPARDTTKALAACAAGIAAAWLPFQIADPHTLTEAGRFTIDNAASSALRALGYTGAYTPSWDRPAQLGLGVALGLLALRRGRWEAVILLGTSARILLDPEVYGYYLGGVVVGTVIFDLVVSGRRTPYLTLAAVFGLQVDRLAAASGLLPISLPGLGWLRVLFVVGAVAVALYLPAKRRPDTPSSAPESSVTDRVGVNPPRSHDMTLAN